MFELRPITFAAAAEYVKLYHRHHKSPQGHKFSIALYCDGRLCGAVIVGRPVSRYLDDGETLEITRLCTDGTRNACTMLYGAACRAAKAQGYARIYTYTLDAEDGNSLKAANFICDGPAGGANWTGERYRQMEMFPQMKKRWRRELRETGARQ